MTLGNTQEHPGGGGGDFFPEAPLGPWDFGCEHLAWLKATPRSPPPLPPKSPAGDARSSHTKQTCVTLILEARAVGTPRPTDPQQHVLRKLGSPHPIVGAPGLCGYPILCRGCRERGARFGRWQDHLSQPSVSRKNVRLPTALFDSCVFIHASVVLGFIASFFM